MVDSPVPDGFLGRRTLEAMRVVLLLCIPLLVLGGLLSAFYSIKQPLYIAKWLLNNLVAVSKFVAFVGIGAVIISYIIKWGSRTKRL